MTRVCAPDRHRHGPPCSVCGKQLRQHNKSGRCASHGRSKSFDHATGKCLGCGVIVLHPRLRAPHALVCLRGGLLGDDEIKKRSRERHATLREDRRALNVCIGCGGEPIAKQTLCVSCRQRSRDRETALRRARGQKVRQPITLTHEGETLSLADWGRRLSMDVRLLWSRWKKGWPYERILLTPRTLVPKTHCLRGHPFDEANVWIYRGKRNCRACMKERCRTRRANARTSKTPFAPEVFSPMRMAPPTPSMSWTPTPKIPETPKPRPPRPERRSAIAKKRAETTKLHAQGLSLGYRRVHICDVDECHRTNDVANGRFATPGGRACERCGETVTTGFVVVERVEKSSGRGVGDSV